MKLGLIAGSGDVPRLIAEDRKARGEDIFIVSIRGYEEDWQKQYPREVCGIAETGKMINALRAAGCNTISLIGNVRRPDFSKLKPDLKAISLLPKVLKAATRGDDALLRSLVAIFETEGFRVVGADELVESLKSQAGYYTNRRLTEQDREDIRVGFKVAGEIGRLDIGQGAVVARGIVLAVEAQEGTDEMLRRVSKLPDDIRGDEENRFGVLLKRPKPIQEARVDLPTIGPSTVRLASEAGLSTITIVEGGALLVDKQEIIRLADMLGMSVVCVTAKGELP